MISQRLKDYIHLHFRTQHEAAELLGLTDGKMSLLLSGKSARTLDRLESVIVKLDTSPEDLYHIVTGKQPPIVDRSGARIKELEEEIVRLRQLNDNLAEAHRLSLQIIASRECSGETRAPERIEGEKERKAQKTPAGPARAPGG